MFLKFYPLLFWLYPLLLLILLLCSELVFELRLLDEDEFGFSFLASDILFAFSMSGLLLLK